MSAFFRPPEEIETKVSASDIAIVALPILCDLVATVRPRNVEVAASCQAPPYRQIFNAAAGALVAEQDAFWCRTRWTGVPRLDGTFSAARPSRRRLNSNRVVLGFSGGKDSVLSLFGLLEGGYDVRPLLLNEGDRTWQDTRRWIPKLKALGLEPMVAYLSTMSRASLIQRYGDWHYSSYQIGWLTALLALCAEKIGAGVIALGLESSADRTAQLFRGRPINHQYQKTTKHILALERFYRRTVNSNLRLASAIAPFDDADVLRALLAHVPKSYQNFSSCGGANSASKHCGKCEKCAYVYVLLVACPRGKNLAKRIFRSDLLVDTELYRPWFDARFRAPLGCIGEPFEVWQSLEELAKSGMDRPVIRCWMKSKIRSEQLAVLGRNRNQPTSSSEPILSAPVNRARQLIGAWIESANK